MLQFSLLFVILCQRVKRGQSTSNGVRHSARAHATPVDGVANFSRCESLPDLVPTCDTDCAHIEGARSSERRRRQRSA